MLDEDYSFEDHMDRRDEERRERLAEEADEREGGDDATDIVRWQIMLDHFPHQHGTFIAECRRMLAEVAALRTENERLTAEARDQCTGCERPTNSVDTFCFVCKLDELEEDRDRLTADLAAERVQHETTRAAVEALRERARKIDNHARRPGWALELVEQLDLILAASPSPVAGQDQPKEPTP